MEARVEDIGQSANPSSINDTALGGKLFLPFSPETIQGKPSQPAKTHRPRALAGGIQHTGHGVGRWRITPNRHLFPAFQGQKRMARQAHVGDDPQADPAVGRVLGRGHLARAAGAFHACDRPAS